MKRRILLILPALLLPLHSLPAAGEEAPEQPAGLAAFLPPVQTQTQPFTDVEDCGIFLERVLAGTNVSPAASEQTLSLLKAQTKTSKFPAGVPEGVVTANKTGEISVAQNDACIVYAPFGTYVVVVLTENGGAAKIKELSSVICRAMEAAS